MSCFWYTWHNITNKVYIHIYRERQICICICIYLCVCVCVYVYVCIYVYIYIHIHINIIFQYILCSTSPKFTANRTFELGIKNEISWKNPCISNLKAEVEVVSFFTIERNQYFHYFSTAETIRKTVNPPFLDQSPLSDLPHLLFLPKNLLRSKWRNF